MFFLAFVAAFAVTLTQVQASIRSEFDTSAIAFNERSVDAAKLHARHADSRLMARAATAWDATHPGLKASIDAAVARTAAKPHYFWSGRVMPALSEDDSVMPMAQKIATARGGTTLEQTVAVRSPASNAVFFVKGESLRPGNVWESYEYPRLKRSKKVKTISEIKVHKLSTEQPHQIWPQLKGCDGVIFIDNTVVCPPLAKSYYGSLKKPVVTASTTAAKDGAVKVSTNGNTAGIATECTEIITGEFVNDLFEKTKVCDAATNKGNGGKVMAQVKSLLNSAKNRNKLQRARLIKQKLKLLGAPIPSALEKGLLDSLVTISYYQKTAGDTAAMAKQIDSLVSSATGVSPGLAAAWAKNVAAMKPIQVRLLALLQKQIAQKVKEAAENKKRGAACGGAPTGTGAGAGAPKAPRQVGLYSGAFFVSPAIRSSLEARAAAARARRSGPKSAAAPSCPLKSAPQKKAVPRSKTKAKQAPAKSPRRPAKTPARKPASTKRRLFLNRARRTPGKAKPSRRPSPKRKPKKAPKPTRRPKGKPRARKTRRR
ncbi:hypothetical protein BKA62DRAFT_714676 [Auriculariales sp. MPI-PUGE-AT-0066]|nr:hypothetical protein BKA62DRAFT_714676 [Auriculariales sp. MPI-PUGE-AT-0066]